MSRQGREGKMVLGVGLCRCVTLKSSIVLDSSD